MKLFQNVFVIVSMLAAFAGVGSVNAMKTKALSELVKATKKARIEVPYAPDSTEITVQQEIQASPSGSEDESVFIQTIPDDQGAYAEESSTSSEQSYSSTSSMSSGQDCVILGGIENQLATSKHDQAGLSLKQVQDLSTLVDETLGLNQPQKNNPQFFVARKPKQDRPHRGFTYSLKNNGKSLAMGLSAAAGLYGVGACLTDPVSAIAQMGGVLVGAGTTFVALCDAARCYFKPMMLPIELLYDEAEALENRITLSTPKVHELKEALKEKLSENVQYFKAIKENMSVADTTESLEVSLERQNLTKANTLKVQIDWLKQECQLRRDRMKLLDCNHKLVFEESKMNLEEGVKAATEEIELKRSFNTAKSTEEAEYKLILGALVDAEIAYYQQLLAVAQQ